MEAAQVPGGEQPAEQTPQAEPTQEGAPPWADSLAQEFQQRLGQLPAEIDQRIDQRLGGGDFRERFQREPEPQEPQYDDLGYLDDRLAGADPNDLRQIVREEFAPLHEGFREQQWESFMRDNPELNDEQVAGPVADMVQAMAEAAGREDLVDDPRFVSRVYGMYQNMQGATDRAVSEKVGPFVDMATERAFTELESEFPKLQTAEGRKELVTLVVERANEYGDRSLVNNPKFVRDMYLAQQGEGRAAGEQPVDDGQQVALEQGGGQPSEPQEESVFHKLHVQRRAGQLDWD